MSPTTMGHMESLHTSLSLEELMDRMIRDNVYAASSFPDDQSRNILVEAAIEAESQRLRAWMRTDGPGEDYLVIYHTFDNRGPLWPKARMLGVARDKRTKRVSICETHTVCMMIAINRRGKYEIANAYPAVTRPYGLKIDEDPLETMKHTRTWSTTTPTGRATLAEMCRKGDWPIELMRLDTDVARLEMQESQPVNGHVLVRVDSATWHVTGERPVCLERGRANTILERAFPQTFEHVEKIWQLADVYEKQGAERAKRRKQAKAKQLEQETTTPRPITLETAKATAKTPDTPPKRQTVTQPQPKPVPERTTDETPVTEIVDEKTTKSKEKARKKALRRSQMAQQKSKRAPKKAKAKTNRERKEQVATSWRNATTATEAAITERNRAQDNLKIVRDWLADGTPLINKERNEMLLPVNNRGLRGDFSIVKLTDDAKAMLPARWNESYSLCRLMLTNDDRRHTDSTTALHHAILAMQSEKSVEVYLTYDRHDIDAELAQIANDECWQPLTLTSEWRKRTQTVLIDDNGRHIIRSCERLNISAMETIKTNRKAMLEKHGSSDIPQMPYLTTTMMDAKPTEKGPIDVREAIKATRTMERLETFRRPNKITI